MDSASMDFGDEDEEGFELSATEVFNQLQTAWMNEKFSPEILQHRSDLVNCVLEELNKIESDVQATGKKTFEGCLKQMEVERIRYMVANYLRIRLQKIERFIYQVVEEEKNKSTKLSAQETQYANDYRKGLNEYLLNTALQHMSRNAQSLQPKQIATFPNFEQFVFLRSEVGIKDVAVQDPLDETREEVFDLDPNTQHLMPYKAISAYLKNGDVCLI